MKIKSESKSRLRIGFLINPSEIEQNTLDLMDAIASNEAMFESPIIIELTHNKSEFLKYISALKQPLKYILTKIISTFEILRIRHNSLYKNYFLTYTAKTILSIRPHFSNASVESLDRQKIDIYIQSSYLKIPESALNQSTYGVIKSLEENSSLDHDLFIGFLEVLKKHPVTSLVLQRSARDPKSDSLICIGKVMTKSLWHHNRAALLKKRNSFILRFLKELYANGFPQEEPCDEEDLEVYHEKISSFHLVKYIFKNYLRSSYFVFKRVFLLSKKYNRWSVSYIKSTNLQTDLSSGVEIKNLPGRFFADPFLIKHKGRTICFVEDFFFDQSKGKISAIELFENNYKFLDIVLEEDFHLSYPFIFVEGDQVYMIPETSQVHEIRLYKATNFPTKWELEEVLMKNVSAVDTVIFKKEDLWFMLTYICSSASDDHSSELHIFYSEKFNSKNWLPIKSSNPVIFDSLRARNGGFFEMNNKKYRVNQVQDFSHYGKCFSVNLVKEISMDNYIEEKIFEIKPNYMKEIISTHHYHSNGEYIVFDYCKNETIA